MKTVVEIHLYGKLRRFGPHTDLDRECVICTSADPSITVGKVLEGLGISLEEISSVFLDGTYDKEGLNRTINGIGRIGLFPSNMGLLYI